MSARLPNSFHRHISSKVSGKFSSAAGSFGQPPKKLSQIYSIAQAAQLIGVSADSLRRWEEEGLCKPERTAGGQRRYRQDQLPVLRQLTRRVRKQKILPSPLAQVKVGQIWISKKALVYAASGLFGVLVFLVTLSQTIFGRELSGRLANGIRVALFPEEALRQMVEETGLKEEGRRKKEKGEVLAEEAPLENYQLSIFNSQNLLKNSSFEAAPSNGVAAFWEFHPNSTDGNTRRSSHAARSGSYTLLLSCGTEDKEGQEGRCARGILQESTKTESGRNYTLGVWAKISATKGLTFRGYRLHLGFGPGRDKSFEIDSGSAAGMTGSDGWEYYSATFENPPPGLVPRIYMSVERRALSVDSSDNNAQRSTLNELFVFLDDAVMAETRAVNQLAGAETDKSYKDYKNHNISGAYFESSFQTLVPAGGNVLSITADGVLHPTDAKQTQGGLGTDSNRFGRAWLTNVDLSENLSINGKLDISGKLTANGNLTLGNNDGDEIEVGGRFTSDLLPKQSNAVSLGTSGNRWNNLFAAAGNISNNLAIGGNTTMTGSLTVSGGMTLSGGSGLSLTGDLSLDGDLDFTGPQNITTTADNLTVSPTGNFIIDTSGGTVYIRDSILDISGQNTTISASNLTVAATGTINRTAAGDITDRVTGDNDYILRAGDAAAESTANNNDVFIAAEDAIIMRATSFSQTTSGNTETIVSAGDFSVIVQGNNDLMLRAGAAATDTSVNNNDMQLSAADSLIVTAGDLNLTISEDSTYPMILRSSQGGIQLSTQSSDNGNLTLYSAGTLTLDSSRNNTNILMLPGSGRIGVGTTAPATAFHISAADGLIIPVGTTAQRASTPTTGTIRYNSQTSQFEGYSDSSWGSLGGVIDVDQDTYVSAETSAGADNDDLRFITAGTQRMIIDETGNIGIGPGPGSAVPAGLLDVVGNAPIVLRAGQSALNNSTSGATSTTADLQLAAADQLLAAAGSLTMLASNDSSYPLLLRSSQGGIQLSSQSRDNGSILISSAGNLYIDTSFYGTTTFIQGGLVRIGDSGSNTTATGADDLYVEGDFEVDGNVSLGASTATSLTVGSYVTSNLIPSPGSTYDLGSNTRRWANVYGDTVTASNISGTVVTGSTSAADWTINVSQGTADLQDSTVTFERGTEVVNSELRWNSSGKRYFSTNAAFQISPDTGITAPVRPEQAILTVNDSYGGRRILTLRELGSDVLNVDSSGNILLSQASNIETSSGALTLRGYSGVTLTTSSATTGEIRLLSRGTLQLDTSTNNTNILVRAGTGNVNVSSTQLYLTGNLVVTGTETFNGVTYTFPGADGSASNVLTTSGTGLLSWGTLGAASITADSLDFTELQDSLDLDADTLINGPYSFIVRTGNAARQNATSGSNDLQLAAQDYLLLDAARFRLATSSATDGVVQIISTGSLLLDTSTNNTDILLNQGSGRVVFSGSGNVGIGSTAPVYKLDVNGTLRTTSTARVEGALTVTTGGASVTGDLTLDGDLDFTGPQNITTTADNLTLSPTGNLIIDTSGGTLAIRDGTIDLTNQPTLISGSSLTLRSTGTFILDTSAQNTDLKFQAGTGNLTSSSGTINLTAINDSVSALYLNSQRGGITLSSSNASGSGPIKILSGGSLQLSTSQGNQPIYLQAGTGGINLSSGTTTISGNLNLNSGTLTLNGVAYTFPGADGSSSNVLTTSGTGLLSWGTLGAASITADSLDFSEFRDSLNLDADTSINGPYSFIIRTGNAARQNATSGNNDLQLSAEDQVLIHGAALTLETSSSTAGQMLFRSDGSMTFDTSGGSGNFAFVGGNVGIGTTGPGAKLQVVGSSDIQQFIVKGNSSQTTNLTEWQNSSGIILLQVENGGSLRIPSSNSGMIYNSGSGGTGSYFMADGLAGSANNAFAASLTSNTTAAFTRGFLYNPTIATGVTITDALGLYIANPIKNGTGAIANNYGVYISDQTAGGTNNFSIYSAGGTNYFGGNVGIGTTSPGGILDVLGQCVTGDTLLKRRRRRRRRGKNGQWLEEEYFENVRIDQIEENDEILTLDQEKGILVVSKINKLLNKGRKPIYGLTTASGKKIRTTGNHPYLVTPKLTKPRVAVFIDAANFEISSQSSGLGYDYKDIISTFFGNEKPNIRYYKVDFAQPKQRRFFGFLDVLGIKLITKPLKIIEQRGREDEHKANFDVEISVDAAMLKDSYDLAVLFSGDSDFTYLASQLQKMGKQVMIVAPWHVTGRELRQQADLFIDLRHMPFIRQNKTPRRGYRNRFINGIPILQQVAPFVKGGKWTKVNRLKAGQMITTAGENGKPVFERIVSIRKLPAEQVYDLEIAATHNFVANGIVAHNTSGLLLRAGASTPTLSSSASSTTADIQLAAADRIDLMAGSLSISTSNTADGSLKLSAKSNLTLDTSQNNANILLLPGTGNVGIGTTGPGYKLVVAGTESVGDLRISEAAGSSGTTQFFQTNSTLQPGGGGWTLNVNANSGNLNLGTATDIITFNGSKSVFNTGNVGLGTTSPAGILDVLGQCVARGTLVPRRKKVKGRRKKGETDEIEYIPVEELESGDEVLSFDPHTGRFEWHKVENIWDKDYQAVIEIQTSTGKRILATGEHPYLTIKKPEITFGTFEVDLSIHPDYISRPTVVGISGGGKTHTGLVSAADKRQILRFYQKLNKQNLFGPHVYAKTIAKILKAAGIYPARIKIDTDYTGYDQPIRDIISIVFPHTEVIFGKIGKHSPAHVKVWEVNRGKVNSDFVLKAEFEDIKKGQGSLQTLRAVSLGVVTQIRRPHGRSLSSPISYYKESELSRAVWLKAGELRHGHYIATVDGWEKVVAVRPAGRQQTYDLAIEATHNFVANGIVAHNTSGLLLRAGASTPTLSSSASSTTADIQLAAADRIDLQSSGFRVQTSSDSAGTLALISRGSLILDTSNSLGGSAPIILQGGNVGVGSTAPGYKLDVAGNFRTTSTARVEGALTVTTGGASVTGDLTLDGDLDFTGAQNITTTADNLTLSPTGNLIIDTSGGTLAIRDGTIDLTNQPTLISGSSLTLRSTGTFILDTSAQNTDLKFQAGTGNLTSSSGTINLTAVTDSVSALYLNSQRGGITLSSSNASGAGPIKILSGGSLQLSTSQGNQPIYLQAGTGNVNVSSTQLHLTGNLVVTGTETFNGVTYTFPGADGSANNVLTTSGTGLLSWGTLGAASITADSLDFTEFRDSLNLDADTSVNGPYSFIIRAGNAARQNATSGNNDLQLSAEDQVLIHGAALTLETSSSTAGQMLFRSDGSMTFDTSGGTGNFAFVGGNVGIGTAGPSGKLHVKDTNPQIILQPSAAGDQGSLVEFRTNTDTGGMALWRDVERTGTNSFAVRDQAAGAVRFYIGSTGNVGIGTTSPAGILDVLGQCVTGDTMLRRRRRRKLKTQNSNLKTKSKNSKPSPEWEEYWEDVRIDEIKAGDEILSMEPDGSFNLHKVNVLMKKGYQPTYKLITHTGKQIRTTAKHPYFVLEKRPKSLLKELYATFEVDQSNRLEDMGVDSVVALASSETDQVITVKISKKIKRDLRKKFYPGRQKFFGPEMLCVLIIYAIWDLGLKVGHLVIDKEYPGYEKPMSKFLYRYYPEITVSFRSIGRLGVAAHEAAWARARMQKALTRSALLKSGANLDFKESLAAELLHPGMDTGDSQSTRLLLPIVYQSVISVSRGDIGDAKWTEVQYLKKGMWVATVDGWEVITAVYKTGVTEEMYDVEIEATHNFVANGIVAHNTTGLLLRAGASTPTLSSSATSTTADIQLAAADRIDLSAAALSLSTSSASAGELKLISRGSLILDTSNSLGGTAPIILQGGNVGIGSTSPAYKLDVAGDFRTTTGAQLATTSGNVGIGTTSPVGLLNVRGATTGKALVELNETGDQPILTASASGVPRFTVGRSDITVNGQKDIITSGMSNVNDVFVYDTTKDSDGGAWRQDARAKASSWYNETLDDGPSDPCVNDTDDRCGRREFPEKAILVATNTDLYIFDAKDNSQWMNFDKGATTTEQMIGPTTNSTGVTVSAREGKIYYGNQGSSGGLYVIDFVRDQGYRYNSTDDYVGDKTVSNRNSTVAWTTGPGQPIVDNSVNDVSAAVVCGGGISDADATNQPINQSTDKQIAESDHKEPRLLSYSQWRKEQSDLSLGNFEAAKNHQPHADGDEEKNTRQPSVVQNGKVNIADIHNANSSIVTAKNEYVNPIAKNFGSSMISTENDGAIRTAPNQAEAKFVNNPAKNLASAGDTGGFISSILHPLTNLVKPETGLADAVKSGSGGSEGDGHQKTASAADLVSQTDSLIDWPKNLDQNITRVEKFVKPQFSRGVDLPGVGPGRLGFLDQSSKPAKPTPKSILSQVINFFSPSPAFAAAGPSCKTYVAVTTDAGVSVINETDQRVINYTNTAGADAYSVALTKDGTLYFSEAKNDELAVFTNIQNDTANQTSADRTYDETSGVALWSSVPSITGSAGSLSVVQGTSSVDGNSNTIYIGHNDGMSRIDEKAGDATNGSVKYYTNSRITEEMTGDIRLMLPLNGTLSTSTAANTTIANADASVKLNPMTTSGAEGQPAYATGVRGTGLTFDGVNDYVCTGAAGTCADDADLDSGGTTWSVGAWVKSTSATNPGATQGVISKRTGGGSGVDSYELRWNTSGGLDWVTTTGTVTDVISTTTTDYYDSNWHFVAGGYDGSTQRLYIDGVQVDSDAQSGNLQNSTTALILGGLNAGASGWFAGTIDEPFVTAEALTPGQIKHMYEVGKRALQNHTASRIVGVTGADNYQRLMGNASGGTSTTSRVQAVAVDDSGRLLYAGLNDATANTGGVTVLGTDSDSAVDLYDATANTSKDDDAGTQFSASDVMAISVAGSPCPDYNVVTGKPQSCNNPATLAIAGTNDTATRVWMETSDFSLYSGLLTLASGNLYKAGDITAGSKLQVLSSSRLSLDTSTAEVEPLASFMVDQTGSLSVTSFSLDASGGVINLGQASATPAASDVVGSLNFTGRTLGAAGQRDISYAGIRGTISSATDQSEAGILSFLTMRAGTLTEAARFDNNGNLGVGTTSPGGILDVLGQCVTGDTMLRRKRRRKIKNQKSKIKNGNPNDIWEDVPITDIRAGDEVMTLDEATGKITVSTVKKLMNMGHKKVFRLTTASGETIKTTAKHPYLAETGNGQTKWIKVTDLTPGDKIAVVKKQSLGAFIDYANMKAWVKRQGKMINLAVLYQALKNSGIEKVSLYYGADPKNPASFGFLQKLRQIGFEVITKPVKYQKVSLLSMLRRPVNQRMLRKLSPATRTALLREAQTLEKKQVRFLSPKANFDVEMSLDMVAFADKFDGFVLFSGDGDFEATVKTLRAAGKKVIIVSSRKFLAEDLYLSADKTIYFEQILRDIPRLAQKSPDEPGKNCELIVSPLSAFVKSQKPAFVPIASIVEEEAEQVYDLAIEATHNFVANGIVAHNTSGLLLRAGASTPTLSSSASSTTADIQLAAADQIDLRSSIFSLSTSGTADGSLKLSAKSNLTLDTSQNNANILAFTGTGNFNVDSGLLFVDGSTSRVGIGTTGPGAKLDVKGDAIFGTAGTAETVTIGQGAGGADAATLRIRSGNSGFTSPALYLNRNGGDLSSFLSNGDNTYLEAGGGLIIRYGIGGSTMANLQSTIFNISSTAFQVTGTGPHYFSSGNLGVGTTSPGGILDVLGQCVAGDTLLKRRRLRRRRGKNGQWLEEEYFENVRIDQIHEGDEILTLDQERQVFAVAKVNKLMDKGIKGIYELTTASGKTIKTTGNHPYYAADNADIGRVAFFIDAANFEISLRNLGVTVNYGQLDQAIGGRVVSKYYFSVDYASQEQAKLFTFLKHHGYRLLTKSIKMIRRRGSQDHSHKANFDVEIAFESLLTQKKYDTFVLFSGDSDFVHMIRGLQKLGKKVIVVSPNFRTAKELKAVANLFIDLRYLSCLNGVRQARLDTKIGPLWRAFDNSLSTAESILTQLTPFVKSGRGRRIGGKWTKVSQLKVGQLIAAAGDNGKPIMERIVSIKKLPAEQVYDIEVEATHNFVANGIVAHNTTGLLLRAGASTPTLSSSATSTTADIQLAAADQIDLRSSIFSLSTSGTADGSLKLSAKSNLTLDTSQNNANILLLPGTGNVGIGTTGPGGKLEIHQTTSGGTADIKVTNDATGNSRARIDLFGNNILGLTLNSYASTFSGTLAGVNIANLSNVYTNAGNGLMLITGDATPLYFVTNNAEVMRITSAGNVGIGTTGPGSLLDVYSTSYASANTRIGNPGISGYLAVGGIAILDDASQPRIFGPSGENLYFGVTGDAVGAALTLKPGGNVGIGTTSPAYQLQLSTDSAAKPSTNTWTIASDARIKNVVGSFNKGLEEILRVNPIVYTYKENNALGIVDPGEHIGIIAQEVQKVFPEAVSTDPNGYLHFNSDTLSWASINAIKELDAKIASQPAADVAEEVASLSARVKEVDLIKTRLSNLEDLVNLLTLSTSSGSNLPLGNTTNLISLQPAAELTLTGSGVKGPLAVSDLPFNTANSTFNILSSASVGGTLTVGLITIDDLNASINSIGETLKIQNQALANVEFLGGKIVMTKAGDVEIAGDLTVSGDVVVGGTVAGSKIEVLEQPENPATDSARPTAASIGEITLPAGQTRLTVYSTAVGANSKVFVTANQPAQIGAKVQAAGRFTIELGQPTPAPLKVSWWVVN